MSEGDEELIQRINKLGETNSADAQNKACRLIYNKFFRKDNDVWSDVSVIPQLLPLLVKMLGSKHLSAQEDAIFYITAITLASSDEKSEQEFTRDVIRAGATDKLLENLSSTKKAVVIKSLRCFVNLAYCFPEEIMAYRNTLLLLVKCLEAKSPEIVFHAVEVLKNLSDCQQNIRAIVDGEVLVSLLNVVKSSSKNPRVIQEILNVLLNLVSLNVETCEYVLEHGVLKLVQKFLSRIPPIRLLATKFVEAVTSFNKTFVDAVIDEEIVPSLLKHLKDSTNSAKVKMGCIKSIMNMIEFNPAFVPALLNYGIVLALSRNFQSSNTEFIVLILSTLDEVIQATENDHKNDERKLRCGALSDLKKLFDHDNVDVQNLSKKVYEYFACEDATNSSVVGQNNNYTYDDDNDDVNGGFDDAEESESEAVVRGPKRRRTTSTESTSSSQPRAKESKNDLQGDEDVFEEFEYFHPSESFLKNSCELLELNLYRPIYGKLKSLIDMKTLSSRSIPSRPLGLIDKSGFGCLSVFLTGFETDGPRIREKLVSKGLNNMDDSSGKNNVRGLLEPLVITPEYFGIFATWLGCRIMVFFDEMGWERYGDWTPRDEPLPLLVMEKEKDSGGFEYVLSVENQ